MGLGVDYKDFKPWTKLAISGLAILMPIVFLDIYVLKREYFESTPIYIIIIWSYLLTIPVFLITTFWSWLFIDTTKLPHEWSMHYGIGLSFIYMSICTYLGMKYHWNFYYFYKILLAMSFVTYISAVKKIIKKVIEILQRK